MLQIDEIQVEIVVMGSGEIKENGVYAIFGNYSIEVGELEKLEADKEEDDQGIALIYDKLLSDGRAVEMARILKGIQPRPEFPSTSTYSYEHKALTNIISYYQDKETLINSMKALDHDAYYKAQVLIAEQYLSKNQIKRENEDEA